MGKKVLVLTDLRDQELRQVALECLAVARQIAGNQKVIAAVLGSSAGKIVDALAHHGADKVVIAEDSTFDQYTTDAYFQAYRHIIEQTKPDVILTGHTAIGRDISPRLAARLGLGLISDCTKIEVDGDEIGFTRPIYAGKAFARKKVRSGTIFATLRPNNFTSLDPDTSRKASVQEISIDLDQSLLRTIIKNVVKKATTGIDLSEARVVIAGGRGVKSAEGFAPLQELADVLGAAVGASRGACDAGYCDYALQIGQTGKVVTPDLYIACGISGAIQHVAGMSNSKVIVAINKDPEAPIFQIADYGIVGDLFEVVPLLTQELKNVLQR